MGPAECKQPSDDRRPDAFARPTPHLELRGPTLFLEYSVLDPGIVTENSPALIASTVLKEYSAEAYGHGAQTALCFDLDWQQRRSVSL